MSPRGRADQALAERRAPSRPTACSASSTPPASRSGRSATTPRRRCPARRRRSAPPQPPPRPRPPQPRRPRRRRSGAGPRARAPLRLPPACTCIGKCLYSRRGGRWLLRLRLGRGKSCQVPEARSCDRRRRARARPERVGDPSRHRALMSRASSRSDRQSKVVLPSSCLRGAEKAARRSSRPISARYMHRREVRKYGQAIARLQKR